MFAASTEPKTPVQANPAAEDVTSVEKSSVHEDPSAVTDIQEVTSEESGTLFKWNLILGLLHLVSGVVLLILTDTKATIPVYSFFSDPDTRGPEEGIWEVAPKLHGNFAVGWWSGISILLSSLDHLLVATVFRKSYEYYLARKVNPFRWIEYSFSASIMHVMIAQLSGVFSVHLLYTVFGFTMVTMIFGYEQEVANQRYMLTGRGSMTIRPFLEGCLPHVFAWSIIFCFFLQGVSQGDAPNFVWAIVFVLFILDGTFPINQWLQQRKIGKWRSYIFGEIVFCILSLVAKQLLAWINFGGTQSI